MPYVTPMRLRVPELLRARGFTAYRLAVDSGGRISLSMAYRLGRTGAFRCLSPEQLDALCEVLQVEPDELFERGRKRRK
jgi:DNA-binding Xre family transcriptional regulator